MVTKQQIVEALNIRFHDLVEALDEVPETHRVIGFVVSPDFEEMDYRERQDALWAAIHNKVGRNELENVGPIAALTPEEASSASDIR